MTSPKITNSERAHIAKELWNQDMPDAALDAFKRKDMKALQPLLADWDKLDDAVEEVLKDLGGSAIDGKYLPADMQMSHDDDDDDDYDPARKKKEISDYEKYYMQGLNPDGTPYK